MKKLFSKLKHNKIFQKITSFAISFAMLLSVGYSCAYGCINNINFFSKRQSNTTNALYSASSTATYNFASSSSWTSAYTSGNSANYTQSLSQSLTDYKTANGYYPISYYYGVSTLSSEQNKNVSDYTGTDTQDKISSRKTSDDYVGLISLNNYAVARKTYTSTSSDTPLYEQTDNSTNIIYVYPLLPDGADKDALETTKAFVEALNNAKGCHTTYVFKDDSAVSYDSGDYTQVTADTFYDEYAAIVTDISLVNQAIAESNTKQNEAEGNQDSSATSSSTYSDGDFVFSYKKTYEWTENYMYFRTLNTTSLSAASYYVVSCWIYTAGNATATLQVSAESGYINAKIENVSTDGLWVNYYLFIETRAASATSIYVFLYYGDENGVTGTADLENFAETDDAYDGSTYYSNNTLTGSVFFDDLKIYKISSLDYFNNTINDTSANNTSLSSIAEDFSLTGQENCVPIVNSSKATSYVLETKTTEEEEEPQTYTPIYIYTENSSSTNAAALVNALNAADSTNKYAVLDSYSKYDSNFVKNNNKFYAIISQDTYSDEYNSILEAINALDGTYNTEDLTFFYGCTEATSEDTNTFAIYNYTNYTSEAELSSVSTYSARYYSSATVFDYSFDGDTENLLYTPTDFSELSFSSYLSSTSNYFSYYMPRYTSDSGTTELSSSVKNQYRKLYSENALEISTVLESEAFSEYQDYSRDQFGNLLDEDGNIVDSTDDAAKEDKAQNTFNNNNSILKLSNKDTEYSLGVVSTAIKIAQFGYYRISIWANSADTEAVATAKLMASIQTGATVTYGSQVLTAATATDFSTAEDATDGYNGWKEIVFYVQGNPYQDVDLYLVLLASTEDTVYYDNLKVEAISSSIYSSGSNKVNLASVGVLSSNVTNGYFNTITVTAEDATNTYPYTASSWTLDDDNTSSVISGIIGTNSYAYSTQLIAAYNEDGELDYLETDEYTIGEENGNTLLTLTKDITINEKTVDAGTKLYPAVNTPVSGTYYYLTDYTGKYIKATTVADMFNWDTAPIYKLAAGTPLETDAYPTNVYAIKLQEENSTFLMTSANIGSSSSSTTLSSENVYKITFEAYVATGFEGNIVANLLSGSDNIANMQLTVDSTLTEGFFGRWQTFTFYFRTGGTNRTSISLKLGATEAKGTMFIQNVNISALSDETVDGETVTVDEQFENILSKYGSPTYNMINSDGTANVVAVLDMLNNNFTAHSATKDEDSNLYTSYSHTQEDLADDAEYTQGILGVVDLTESTYSYEILNDDDTTKETITINLTTNPATDNPTALLLLNTKETDYTYASSDFSTALAASSWYKITLQVKTSDLADNGLKIVANGITETFSNINTYASQENNGYVTYTFYVATGSSSISAFSLDFELGTDDGESFTGWAIVSNIQVTSLTEDEYTQDTTADGVADDDTVIIKNLAVTTSDDDSSSDDSSKDDYNFSWTTFFLVLSSVLLVIALVIAIVGTVIKKKSKKQKPGAGGFTTGTAASGNNSGF